MASSSDQWTREYNEASKLADDITGMISERSSFGTGPEAQRHSSAIRRKITILGTRLDSLQSLLTKLPAKQPLTEKEMNRRRDNLANLRTKVTQMASTLNMSNFGNRDSLLGPDIKPADAMSRIAGLDNSGVVGLQRQIMREQDEGLEQLEETVLSTKHIALAVNEELGLHTRLIDDLDEHVEVTDSRLKSAEKSCGSEQTHQRWLFLLVPSIVRDWNCTPCCGFVDDHKVFVMRSAPTSVLCEVRLLILITIDQPKEYLVAISGTTGNYDGYNAVNSLCIVTNKKHYGPYGTDSGTRFSYDGKCGVIVGFHGHDNKYLEAIGVYVKPQSLALAQSATCKSNSVLEGLSIPPSSSGPSTPLKFFSGSFWICNKSWKGKALKL
ncbi:syntaxin of plants 52 [Artemisia annua]|uniref:Syntaxin of plants 52 n=1 Tax=Artemisia annua TaxID=35608 RepID=A0A2U1NHS7_ARTAN|nr:syntaxin of plants 52 [Artemisia annua]